jgi:glutamate formiminotransferase/formiminotetrahydrofolate cyclodeaminase
VVALKLVECVPNFSEGVRKDVIDAIVAEARSRNVKVLDIESDIDHNRSVLTFAGTPEAVKEAALAVSGKAIELIDLNKHKGQHPRMGAVDVVPFVPVSDVTMNECIELARNFAKEYATRFNVPVYLYEEAATRRERRDLANVRKGEFEGLREEIGKNPDREPDFGPSAIHPTAGATAVGARQVLIAYNINLGTGNLDVAKYIAKQVRAKDGGLSSVKALGFELKEKGIVQVSMNMVNYKASQLFKVFELVRSFARRFGVNIIESEIVGLVPMEALIDTAAFYLQLKAFNKNQILETKVFEKSSDRLISEDLESFSAEVASDKPVPGGGSVSAYTAALGASLVEMAARLTLKKSSQAKNTEVMKILGGSEDLRRCLLKLVDLDAESFSSLMQAYWLPKETDQQKRERSAEIQTRLKNAAEVPLRTAKAAINTASLARTLTRLAEENIRSDLETAFYIAHAAALGAISNVKINLLGIRDEQYRKQTELKLTEIEEQLENEKLHSTSSRLPKVTG